MNAIIKRLKSKTYWAALLGAVLTVVEINSGLISTLLPEGYREWALMFWPVLMLTLREVTKDAIASK